MKKQYLLLVIILVLIIVTATAYTFKVNKKNILTSNDNLPAFSRGAITPGNFSIKSISVKCVNGLPQVSLAWSQSVKADSYSIERMYPWGGDWEVTGEVTNLSYVDKTYEPNYDIGDFTYRVKAYNKTGGIKYSNSQKIKITECTTEIPPTTTCSGLTTQSCTILNGTGSQTRTCNSGIWSVFGGCTLVSCNSGYQISGNSCIAVTTPPINPTTTLQWGAYVGDGTNDLTNFESLVGKKMNLYADFEGWSNSFPSSLSIKVGSQGKTLVIFWEPSFGYDSIINGSKDTYIKQFAASAKSYNYPVILAPFDEMNLNEEAWGYGMNNNTSLKFRTAWQHIHDLFISAGATNVKFAITFNNVSIPSIAGNKMSDYYPGDSYVDYIGLDGFNFANPWQTFAEVFDSAVSEASVFNKPIYILSTASEAGIQKSKWITDGLGTTIKKYSNVLGWVWFNQGGSPNWIINSDSASLNAFKAILQ